MIVTSLCVIVLIIDRLLIAYSLEILVHSGVNRHLIPNGCWIIVLISIRVVLTREPTHMDRLLFLFSVYHIERNYSLCWIATDIYVVLVLALIRDWLSAHMHYICDLFGAQKWFVGILISVDVDVSENCLVNKRSVFLSYFVSIQISQSISRVYKQLSVTFYWVSVEQQQFLDFILRVNVRGWGSY